MDEQSLFEKCPSTMEEWVDAASKGYLLAVSAKDYADHKPGSNITQAQFIVLRTLIKAVAPQNFNSIQFDLKNRLERAGALLQNSPGFMSYIHAISTNSMGGIGEFFLLRQVQFEMLEAYEGRMQPRQGLLNRSPVKTSAIRFLTAIFSILQDGKTKCRSNEINFVAKFGSGEGREFIASTSGQIQDITRSFCIMAPVSCTNFRRQVYGSVTDMQEAALFVAWIKAYPGYPAPKRRVIISHNGTEFYLTFALRGDGWLKSYLEQGNTEVKESGFMTMHRYGPWLINNADHMAKFASIVLAISL